MEDLPGATDQTLIDLASPACRSGLASVTTAQENVLDLRAILSQMTDIAGEVLGEEADQGSLRDSYLSIRLRVDTTQAPALLSPP